ncbi:TrwC relaxase domain protein, partial [mine drainage metagenome]
MASAVHDRVTGDWRSLDARELYAIRNELEGILQNALAHGSREAGFAVDWAIDGKGNPSFELREVPESLRLAASSRKAEIDAELAAHGINREDASVGQRQAATMATRQAKEPVADRAEL